MCQLVKEYERLCISLVILWTVLARRAEQELPQHASVSQSWGDLYFRMPVRL